MYKIYQVVNETLEDIAKKINTTSENLKKINGINSAIPGSYIIIPTNESEYKKYIVKQGDNVYTIARENGVDYNTLLKINGLNENDYIYPNQEILIPNNNIYITGENETINDIINKLKIDIEQIQNIGELYLVRDQIIKF